MPQRFDGNSTPCFAQTGPRTLKTQGTTGQSSGIPAIFQEWNVIIFYIFAPHQKTCTNPIRQSARPKERKNCASFCGFNTSKHSFDVSLIGSLQFKHAIQWRSPKAHEYNSQPRGATHLLLWMNFNSYRWHRFKNVNTFFSICCMCVFVFSLHICPNKNKFVVVAFQNLCGEIWAPPQSKFQQSANLEGQFVVTNSPTLCNLFFNIWPFKFYCRQNRTKCQIAMIQIKQFQPWIYCPITVSQQCHKE